MTEAEFRKELQSAQDIVDAVIAQRNGVQNENARLMAEVTKANRRVAELEGVIAKSMRPLETSYNSQPQDAPVLQPDGYVPPPPLQ